MTIGRAFVPKARSVMRELEDALVGIKEVTDRVSGQVTIACMLLKTRRKGSVG